MFKCVARDQAAMEDIHNKRFGTENVSKCYIHDWMLSSEGTSEIVLLCRKNQNCFCSQMALLQAVRLQAEPPIWSHPVVLVGVEHAEPQPNP